jgi:GT2 family glycosyltransferase
LNDKPVIDVVIVSYCCRSLLRDCLESLTENAASVPTRIHVVDNASRDGTVEMVRESFPDVDLIESEKNLGFGRATNLAIARGDARYVLALNPDTRVTPHALERLIGLMDERPEVAICGCRLVRDDGSLDHAAKRSFPTPLSALGHFTGLGRLSKSPRSLAAYTAPDIEAGPVDAVNGAFMLMRRKALEEIGLFDEGYWMYMEDLDLCYRAAEYGWLTWYEPSVDVHHVKAGTSGEHRSLRLNYAFHYGMFRFYKTHYAHRNRVALNLLVYTGIAAKLSVSVGRSAAARTRNRIFAALD